MFKNSNSGSKMKDSVSKSKRILSMKVMWLGVEPWKEWYDKTFYMQITLNAITINLL